MIDLKERNRRHKMMTGNVIIVLLGLAIGVFFSGIVWPQTLH